MMKDFQDLPNGFYGSVANPTLCLIQSLLNPLRVAKILIQLGYEPLPSTTSKTPFFLFCYPSPTITCFPNAFSYARHLLQTHGVWRVLSCGFMSNLCYDALSEACEFIAHHYWVEKILGSKEWLDDEEVLGRSQNSLHHRFLEKSTLKGFCQHLFSLCLFKVYEVIITHPFYVVSIRQAASLLTLESNYSWFYQAALSIFTENGLRGFFSGIVPRLIRDLSRLLIYFIICRLLHRKLFGSKLWSEPFRNTLRFFSYATINIFSYRFEVVSCVMAVRGSRINAVEVAAASKFSGWLQCYRALSHSGQLQRGFFPFWRVVGSQSTLAVSIPASTSI